MVSDDVILEQVEFSYDSAGNVVSTVVRRRYHNAPDNQTGPLEDPATTPKARVTYTASYRDALGRVMATADYGTNGGTALSRPATVPARSDNVLVTTTGYNSRGEAETTTDPAGLVTVVTNDDAGREIERIVNPQGSSSSSSSSSSSGGCLPSDDTNVTTRTSYTPDGNVASITAVNPTTGDQVTSYTYGTTLAESDIATSNLKRYETYPDSVGGSDRVAFTYNRQRQVTSLTDQNGTVHSFDFDKLGRATQDRITTLGSGVDGAVRRLATRYEVRGMRVKLSSYDHATVGSGSLVNEVQFAYNDFGQLIADYQSHSGAVNTGSTPKVQYGYANGSANTIRPTSLTYPNGRVLSYDYGTAGGIPDALSRIDAIKDGGTALAQYSYLGLGTFVIRDYTEPDIKWILNDLSGTNDPDTGDIYSGFDRFGRVKDNRWYNYGSVADTDRIKYGYDRAGNRIWRQNTVATSLGKAFDEFYWYDGIHRLKDMQRGTLNAGKTGITVGTSTFAECWGLDTTGNWSNYRQDDDGDGSWDLIQNRANNTVNEITNITESAGPSWITPVYDAVGNMTTIPKPANPAVGYTGIYDAWNRLVAVKEGGDFVAEYAYDGTKRRTIQKTYSSGNLSETRHLYYTEPRKWQVVEERTGTSPDSADAEHQFVWGLINIPLFLVLTDHFDSGVITGRFYAVSDTVSVTSVVRLGATVVSRISYTAYGDPSYLDSSFVPSGLLAPVPFQYQLMHIESHVGFNLTQYGPYFAQIGNYNEPRNGDNGVQVSCEWSPAVTTGKCGGAYHRLCFTKAGSEDGWIIQRVGAVSNVRDCDNVLISRESHDFCEAWQVVGGDVYTGLEIPGIKPVGGRDEFRFSDQGWGTRGRGYMNGRAYFLPGYTLKFNDQGGNWDRPGTIPSAGHLPTMNGAACRQMLSRELAPDAPSFWHDLQVSWDCCCGEHSMNADSQCRGCDKVGAGGSHCMGTFED